MWEGLFQLACLIRSHPAEEAVYSCIMDAILETEDGSFSGTIDQQICTARAALSVFEYNTDRKILKRLSQWFRYLEISWEEVSSHAGFLIQPADLMELLVRFYQISGVKSALRICSRLRSSSFDWTTSLHTFQQSIPVSGYDPNTFRSLLSRPLSEIDYNEKQTMINHAVLLADGFRYSLYAGLFSGNRQDLSAGETAWHYLKKHHRAVCGGTSSDPLLCGCGSDKAVSTMALAAWAEAFASQMCLERSEWAACELIRILFNGLSDCLNRSTLPSGQYVNTLNAVPGSSDDPALLYARMTRSVAAAYHHAVTVRADGSFRINYLLPAKMLLMVQKQPVVLLLDENGAAFQTKSPFTSSVEVLLPAAETADLYLFCDQDRADLLSVGRDTGRSQTVVSVDRQWNDQDGFRFVQGDRIFCEPAHHKGICVFVRNRLMALNVRDGRYQFAASAPPEISGGKTVLSLRSVGHWSLNGDLPADIPVLPSLSGDPVLGILTPYDETPARITVFPAGK